MLSLYVEGYVTKKLQNQRELEKEGWGVLELADHEQVYEVELFLSLTIPTAENGDRHA